MFARIGKLFIEYYWRKTAESDRRVCIHKISCSKAVYIQLDKFGLIKGIKTYLARRRSCNEFYELIHDGDHVKILTKNGLVITEDKINPLIVTDFKLAHNKT
jgi:putative component of membrane protein insertase Oxa1/YidC/SpoIIIJ protein YidD